MNKLIYDHPIIAVLMFNFSLCALVVYTRDVIRQYALHEVIIACIIMFTICVILLLREDRCSQYDSNEENDHE